MSVTYSERVFVAFGNQHAMDMRHLWLASVYNIFPHYLIKGKLKKKVTEHKMCVLNFSTNFV